MTLASFYKRVQVQRCTVSQFLISLLCFCNDSKLRGCSLDGWLCLWSVYVACVSLSTTKIVRLIIDARKYWYCFYLKYLKDCCRSTDRRTHARTHARTDAYEASPPAESKRRNSERGGLSPKNSQVALLEGEVKSHNNAIEKERSHKNLLLLLRVWQNTSKAKPVCKLRNIAT